jgi:hypothetical protein
LEETLYLFCQSGAHGIFSESIQTAILAAELGCGDESNGGLETSPTSSPVAVDAPSSSAAADTSTNQQGESGKCSQEQQQESSSQATVGLASFAAGDAKKSRLFDTVRLL